MPSIHSIYIREKYQNKEYCTIIRKIMVKKNRQINHYTNYYVCLIIMYSLTLFFASMSAPAFNKTFTISTWPYSVECIKTVAPG